MGTRIVYQVRDYEHNIIATLFSNSSHTTQFAEEVLDAALASPDCRYGPTALVEKLLTLRYATEEGNHRVGDRIFYLVRPDSVTHAGREASVVVTQLETVDARPLDKGFDSTQWWHKQRIEV